MKTLDINDFRKIANPNTGLVPMKVVREFAPHDKGEIAGFTPDSAMNLIESGHCELLDPEMQGAAEKQIAQDRARRPVAVTSADLSLDTEKEGPVEIPADWRGQHPLKRQALAKKLAGEYVVPKDIKPTDYADTIIDTEEKRRASAP